MCGFLGAWAFNGAIEEYAGRLSHGLSAIRHRGPDSSNEVADHEVYLGHNRLSIIDLTEAANQPLRAARADAWIVYNGEIYNYEELKRNLSSVRFATRSDTEVLLEGYLTEGASFFRKVRGIYAFAILDRRSSPKLILGRDPAGVKPLYYSRHRDLFVFGSEIKALMPVLDGAVTVDDDVIKAYLNLGFCPEPYTIYREIRALDPGQIIEVSAAGWSEAASVRYSFGDENRLTLEENTSHVAELLDQAVRRNLVADVPTAVALSGGIDSSLVYARAIGANPDVRGLTVRFDDPGYDEATAAQAFARHVSGRQLIIQVDADFNREVLDRLLLHFDQPFADSSAIPVYYLTKGTQQFTRVLLGGDGGDELFNGYASLASLPTARRVGQAGVGGIVARLLAFGSTLAGDDTRRTLARAGALLADKPADMLFDWLSWLPRNTRHDGRTAFLYPQDDGLQLYHSVFRNQQPQSFEARLVFEHFTKLLLSDYLRKTDMMSMLNGIEYRVPLLDEDLVGFALSIPFRQKSSLRSHKKILRALHQRTFPPESSQAPKRGFSIPLKDHLTADDLRHMQELVLGPGSLCRSFVRADYLQFVFDVATGKRQGSRHLSPAGIFQRALLFYSLELWHRQRASRNPAVGTQSRQPIWAMAGGAAADPSSRVPFFSSN